MEAHDDSSEQWHPEVDPQAMSRWHIKSCLTPDVVITGHDTVFCRTCHRAPNISGLIVKARLYNPSVADIPPDEAYGAYNLSWPSSIRYCDLDGRPKGTAAQTCIETTKHATGSTPSSGQSGCDDMDEDQRDWKIEDENFDDETGATLDDQDSPSQSAYWLPPVQPKEYFSHIFEMHLTANQFRLIRLDTNQSGNPEAPVHFTLETHDDERHPEYETVSYTWGGEDGDSSLCRPVYVGDYWDVLLQTPNCRDMLRSLRSRKHQRLIWVDAICINQQDNLERAAQVDKMRTIYKNGRRVVVYLGPDLVDVDYLGGYPLRRSLEDVFVLHSTSGSAKDGSEDSKANFGKVLERRYFGRVWVIQELLLSRAVTILYKDMELLADSLSMAALSQEADFDDGWELTKAPWVKHSTQGRFSNFNILDLMMQTSGSYASDPRDKVFGLLGLVHEGSLQSGLRPDYSVSRLHVLIGVAAHCLLNLGLLEILCAASGGAHRPSWMPDWTIWALETSSLGAFTDAVSSWRYSSESTGSWSARSFRDWQNDLGGIDDDIYELSTTPGHWNRRLYVDSALPLVRDTLPWDLDATVDRSTAALSINLTHLTTLSLDRFSLSSLFRLGSLRAFMLRPRTLDGRSRPKLLLVSPKNLTHLVKTEDQIFVLEKADGPPLVLILRPVENQSQSRNDISNGGGGHKRVTTFTFVAHCQHIFFGFPKKLSPSFRAKSFPATRSLPLCEAQYSLNEVLSGVSSLLTAESCVSATDMNLRASSNINEEEQSIIFPGVKTYSESLRVLQGLLNESRATQPDFPTSYMNNTQSIFSKWLDGDYLFLLVAEENMEELGFVVRPRPKDAATILPRSRWDVFEYWTWKYSGDDRWDYWSMQLMDGRKLNMGRVVQFRTSIHDLRHYARGLREYRALVQLSPAYWATGETEEMQILRLAQKATSEGRSHFEPFTACPQWPIELVNEFRITGSTYRVDIY
ncbi:heterokaryon incompatibility protein-domain-containing protein [Podospora australis]|uniref:Heterokaryon incompatibility protein-domain-containing protein n=1 Tax=Podospora australis TaxID=1536484 RepID=A0AAN6WXE9_9PEZI|nr:heterokaryon incompatibility protein-domain-containing protein [Podospora australis]